MEIEEPFAHPIPNTPVCVSLGERVRSKTESHGFLVEDYGVGVGGVLNLVWAG